MTEGAAELGSTPKTADTTPMSDGQAAVQTASAVATSLRPDSPEKRPLLGEAQLAAFRRYGSEGEVGVGDILFSDGDAEYDLIVILEGRVADWSTSSARRTKAS